VPLQHRCLIRTVRWQANMQSEQDHPELPCLDDQVESQGTLSQSLRRTGAVNLIALFHKRVRRP
jgi:hypothetical protein